MEIHLETINSNPACQTVTTIVITAGETFYIAGFADKGANSVVFAIYTRVLTGFG